MSFYKKMSNKFGLFTGETTKITKKSVKNG